MIPYLEPMLYIDPQAAVPVCLCEWCGGECYPPSGICHVCREDGL